MMVPFQIEYHHAPPPPRGVRMPRLAPWQMRRVREHIEERMQSSLPLQELATVSGISRSQFARAFKGSFGQPPHGYIVARRIARAQQAMLAGSEPLSQIALTVGFADQAHFTRVFRRLVGVTPCRWLRTTEAVREAA